MLSIRFDFDTPEAAIAFLTKQGIAAPATQAPAAATTEPTKNKGGRPRKTPAEPAAAAALAPAAQAPAATTLTPEVIRAKLEAIRVKDGAKAARALLTKYAPSMTDLKPADYAAAYADACAALGEGQQTNGGDDDFLN